MRLAADLGQALAGARNYEDTLDALRRWAGERRFQVGVQLLRRALDGRQAGAVLADIAETALAALLPAVEGGVRAAARAGAGGAFAVIGMGRLGSREMTLASDLDLILIYDAPAGSEVSDGPHPLAVASYYARLSQRLIGAITAPTAEGRLYEVDMRLRPSGASGPIASSLRRLRPVPARIRLDLGAHGADPGAAGRRRLALCGSIADAIRAVLCAPRDAKSSLGRCRRHAPAHREGKPATLALGPEKPPRRADRSRIHRAIPDAARGGGVSATPPPRHRAGAPGARRGGRAAARKLSRSCSMP